jgi:hypothetical protein
MTNLNLNVTGFVVDVLDDIEIDDIDMNDYPDFCDAYISSATYKGVELTDDQLDELNDLDETKSWVNANAFKYAR